MKEEKTAEQVLREIYHEYGIEYKPSHILADSVAPIAMQSYSDQQNSELRERVKELEAENARYRDRIGETLKFLQPRQQTTPGLGAPVTILKQALEK